MFSLPVPVPMIHLLGLFDKCINFVIMEVIQKILNLLELAARGRSSSADETNLSNYAKELLVWSSAVPYVEEGDSSMVNTAVMLHNKVRNIAVSEAHNDIIRSLHNSCIWTAYSQGIMYLYKASQ